MGLLKSYIEKDTICSALQYQGIGSSSESQPIEIIQPKANLKTEIMIIFRINHSFENGRISTVFNVKDFEEYYNNFYLPLEGCYIKIKKTDDNHFYLYDEEIPVLNEMGHYYSVIFIGKEI